MSERKSMPTVIASQFLISILPPRTLRGCLLHEVSRVNQVNHENMDHCARCGQWSPKERGDRCQRWEELHLSRSHGIVPASRHHQAERIRFPGHPEHDGVQRGHGAQHACPEESRLLSKLHCLSTPMGRRPNYLSMSLRLKATRHLLKRDGKHTHISTAPECEGIGASR